MEEITKEMARFYVPSLSTAEGMREWQANFFYRLFNNKITVDECKEELKQMWEDANGRS
mgnify:FL=1